MHDTFHFIFVEMALLVLDEQLVLAFVLDLDHFVVELSETTCLFIDSLLHCRARTYLSGSSSIVVLHG